MLTLAFVLVLVGIILLVILGPLIHPCLGVSQEAIQLPTTPARLSKRRGCPRNPCIHPAFYSQTSIDPRYGFLSPMIDA